jgi:hypothetical protein
MGTQCREFRVNPAYAGETCTRGHGEVYARSIPGRYPFRLCGTSMRFCSRVIDCLPWREIPCHRNEKILSCIIILAAMGSQGSRAALEIRRGETEPRHDFGPIEL